MIHEIAFVEGNYPNVKISCRHKINNTKLNSSKCLITTLTSRELSSRNLYKYILLLLSVSASNPYLCSRALNRASIISKHSP